MKLYELVSKIPASQDIMIRSDNDEVVFYSGDGYGFYSDEELFNGLKLKDVDEVKILFNTLCITVKY